MVNARILKATLLTGTLLAASGLPAWAAASTVNGTVNATINVNFAVAPASGAQVTCTLILVGSDALAPSDTSSVTMTVNGSSASCSLPVRYKWRVQSTTSDMAISYSVSGPARTSSGIFEVLALPPNGTKTKVTIGVAQ
jgi:hypothetical protein